MSEATDSAIEKVRSLSEQQRLARENVLAAREAERAAEKHQEEIDRLTTDAWNDLCALVKAGQ